MVQFCFPAFKFPIEKKHKVQRALGIAIMSVFTERALADGSISTECFQPLYPIISDDCSEVIVMAVGSLSRGSSVLAVRNFTLKLPERFWQRSTAVMSPLYWKMSSYRMMAGRRTTRSKAGAWHVSVPIETAPP